MHLDAAVRGDAPRAVTLNWADANRLAVEYGSARNTTIPFNDVRIESRKVRIEPRPGTSGPAAAPAAEP
jgi:hypothetical protein